MVAGGENVVETNLVQRPLIDVRVFRALVMEDNVMRSLCSDFDVDGMSMHNEQRTNSQMLFSEY